MPEVFEPILADKTLGEIKAVEEKVEEILSGNCENCGKEVGENNKGYRCVVCNKIFCISCEGTHIPPASKNLEARVIYKYKPKNATVWTGDVAKFEDTMRSPICTGCYDKEYVRLMWRMKWQIKHWKIDILRDEDMKIIDEIAPGEPKRPLAEDKARAAKFAREFLVHLGKISKPSG
jgi:hypothetical protein